MIINVIEPKVTTFPVRPDCNHLYVHRGPVAHKVKIELTLMYYADGKLNEVEVPPSHSITKVLTNLDAKIIENNQFMMTGVILDTEHNDGIRRQTEINA